MSKPSLYYVKMFVFAFFALIFMVPQASFAQAQMMAEIGCETVIFVKKHTMTPGVLKFRFLMECDEDIGTDYQVIFNDDQDDLTQSELITLVQQYNQNFTFNHIDHNGAARVIDPFTLSRSSGKYVYHLFDDLKLNDPRLTLLLPQIYNPDDLIYLGGQDYSKIGGMSSPSMADSPDFFLTTGSGMSKKDCENAVNDFLNAPGNDAFNDCVGHDGEVNQERTGKKNKISCSKNCPEDLKGSYSPKEKSITICVHDQTTTGDIDETMRHESIHKKQDSEPPGLGTPSGESEKDHCEKIFKAEMQAYMFEDVPPSPLTHELCLEAGLSASPHCNVEDSNYQYEVCKTCVDYPYDCQEYDPHYMPKNPCPVSAPTP